MAQPAQPGLIRIGRYPVAELAAESFSQHLAALDRQPVVNPFRRQCAHRGLQLKLRIDRHPHQQPALAVVPAFKMVNMGCQQLPATKVEIADTEIGTSGGG